MLLGFYIIQEKHSQTDTHKHTERERKAYRQAGIQALTHTLHIQPKKICPAL